MSTDHKGQPWGSGYQQPQAWGSDYQQPQAWGSEYQQGQAWGSDSAHLHGEAWGLGKGGKETFGGWGSGKGGKQKLGGFSHYGAVRGKGPWPTGTWVLDSKQ